MQDVFRENYVPLDDSQKIGISEIKKRAKELYDYIEKMESLINKHEMELAKTNLEQTVMWAVKGFTYPLIVRHN